MSSQESHPPLRTVILMHQTPMSYVHILKHVYLHKNKLTAKECIDMCFGMALISSGVLTRTGLNYMMDSMGGKQVRNWTAHSFTLVRYECTRLFRSSPAATAGRTICGLTNFF